MARHARRFYGQAVDPEAEITVTSGATEAMFAAMASRHTQHALDLGSERLI